MGSVSNATWQGLSPRWVAVLCGRLRLHGDGKTCRWRGPGAGPERRQMSVGRETGTQRSPEVTGGCRNGSYLLCFPQTQTRLRRETETLKGKQVAVSKYKRI